MQFQGKRVSKFWHRILTEAWKRGVRFQLNSGQRTMAEQWYQWRNRGKPGFAKLVAFPSPFAPHIRKGRQNHCLDVDTKGNGNHELAAYLARHGVHVAFNVPGEPWHMDPVNAAELRSFYIRLRKEDKRRRG